MIKKPQIQQVLKKGIASPTEPIPSYLCERLFTGPRFLIRDDAPISVLVLTNRVFLLVLFINKHGNNSMNC